MSNDNNDNNKSYGLFTTITMICGIVIGSGIFFKSDDLLQYTGGNVFLGIVVFVVAAIAIIFGGLAVSQLAIRTDKPGGIIAYAEEFINPKVGTAFGWFQTLIYFGALPPILSYVAGVYICTLFGIEPTTYATTSIGFICFVVLFLANIISARLGGAIQNTTMIIKLIPLFVLIIVGLVKGNPSASFQNDIASIKAGSVGLGFMAGFIPIAFSFEGWIVSTSICHEIKNSKRNLPLALIISPIFVLAVYILYFVGVTSLVGVDQVLELGNDAASYAVESLFGATASKVFLICVIVSVLGTLNGLVLGGIRMPYSLALRNMFPKSEVLAKTSDKFNGMPINSAIFTFVLVTIFTIIRFAFEKYFGIDDISEVFIGVSYLNYIFLYIAVIKLAQKGEIKSKVSGYFVPVMAIIGALIVFAGIFFTAKLLIWTSILAYVVVLALGYNYGKNAKIN